MLTGSVVGTGGEDPGSGDPGSEGPGPVAPGSSPPGSRLACAKGGGAAAEGFAFALDPMDGAQHVSARMPIARGASALSLFRGRAWRPALSEAGLAGPCDRLLGTML